MDKICDFIFTNKYIPNKKPFNNCFIFIPKNPDLSSFVCDVNFYLIVESIK